MACRFNRERGLSWSDVLTPRASQLEHAGRGWRELAAACLENDGADCLSDWEVAFLANLRRRVRPPTEKQQQILNRIALSLGVEPSVRP